ncbi:hypothetical protein [Stieleria varia]|uniref:Uncharacterized protein n=1 Tax=Stieleria varia TaxID=2528005 RepID=A0A5C6AG18_9BACT|nr:hypothetical protein [Stieleria varia]TWT98258.1 hypothetical protein Pla52n_47680 [Stieleria varia]
MIRLLRRRWYRSLLLALLFAWAMTFLGAGYLEYKPFSVAGDSDWMQLVMLGLLSAGTSGFAMLIVVALLLKARVSVAVVLVLVVSSCYTTAIGARVSLGEFIEYRDWFVFGLVSGVLIWREATRGNLAGERYLQASGMLVLGPPGRWNVWMPFLVWLAFAAVAIILPQETVIDVWGDISSHYYRSMVGGEEACAFATGLVGFGIAIICLHGTLDHREHWVRSVVATVTCSVMGLLAIGAFTTSDWLMYRYEMAIIAVTGMLSTIGISIFLSRTGWQMNPEPAVGITFQNRLRFSSIEREKGVVRKHGWPTVCGLVLAAVAVRIAHSWLFQHFTVSPFSDLDGFVFAAMTGLCMTAYCVLLTSITLVVVSVGITSGQSFLATLLQGSFILTATDAIAQTLMFRIDTTWEASLLYIVILAAPALSAARFFLLPSGRRSRWIGPSPPTKRTRQWGIGDLMWITLVVGVELAAVRAIREYWEELAVVAVLMTVILFVTAIMLRIHLAGWWLLDLVKVFLLLSIPVSGAILQEVFQFSIFSAGTVPAILFTIGPLFLTIYLVAGWLEQNGWRGGRRSEEDALKRTL